MLLDEPFSALDTDLRVDTRSAVRRLLDATGITAILVTHDRDDALGFADEVALMNAGRVVRTGPRQTSISRQDHEVSTTVRSPGRRTWTSVAGATRAAAAAKRSPGCTSGPVQSRFSRRG